MFHQGSTGNPGHVLRVRGVRGGGGGGGRERVMHNNNIMIANHSVAKETVRLSVKYWRKRPGQLT